MPVSVSVPPTSVTIVKPVDWEFIREERLVAVVDGVDAEGFEAQLFPSDAFFAGTAGTPLAAAPVLPMPGGVGRVTLDGVGAWGRCVLRVTGPEGAERALIGLQLGHSEHTAWLPEPPPPPEAGGFVFPVRVAYAAASHTGGEVLVETERLPGLRELVAASPSDRTRMVMLSAPVALDGAASLALPFCLGTDDPSFAQMLARGQRLSNEPYVARFRNAVAGVPSGAVLLREGLWSDSAVALSFNDPALRQQPGLFRARGAAGYMGGAVSSRRILDANGLGHFPGIPMLLANVGWRNHAHWVMNSMLPAFYAREEIAAGRICLLVPEYSAMVFDSLMALGIPRSALLVTPPGLYHLEEVLFPSTLSTHVNRATPPETAAMAARVRAHARARLPGHGPRLVYFTRQGSGAQRRIGNEAELIAALRRRGFAIVAPHELHFAAEVRSVMDAAVVVGQLGAALINAVFAPPGAWLVELASANYLSDDYWVQSTMLDQRFVRLLTAAPTGAQPTFTDFSFDLDLPATLDAIDRVVAAALGGDAPGA